MFNKCINCIQPIRHSGCHDNCPDYKRDKNKLADIKVERDKEVFLNTWNKSIKEPLPTAHGWSK